jgi:tripartite-type tricarboxylate transporter receptor subunit TctC
MIISVLFAIMITGEAGADSVTDFYKGKRITLLVGYGPGGGFDTRARIVGKFMGRHIPGNPEIVVQNMPGAGTKRLANHLYNVAPRDGTVFGVINEAMATNTLFKVEGTEFDGLKFTWLGSLLKDPSICFAWHDSGIKTMDDLMTREFVVGATGTGSTSYILPTTMKRFLGTNIKAIPGYKGSKGVMLAVEQGEVQGMCGLTWQTLNTFKPDWVSEGKVTVIGQMGLGKDPDLPDVPLMLDMVKDEDNKAAWKLLFANRAMGNPYVAPPGLPADRKQALRRAFDATVHDPEFLAEAEKLKMVIRPSAGEEIDALLEQTYAAPGHVVDLATEVLETQK